MVARERLTLRVALVVLVAVVAQRGLTLYLVALEQQVRVSMVGRVLASRGIPGTLAVAVVVPVLTVAMVGLVPQAQAVLGLLRLLPAVRSQGLAVALESVTVVAVEATAQAGLAGVAM